VFRFLLAVMVGFAASGVAAAARPNILFIAIDDLNDWVGCLGGHPQVRTPHMDRLAKRGTVFLNAHCQSPLCNPSRTSVLTGLRPSTTGVYALNPWFRTAAPFKDHVTLPQYLMAHGYTTLTTGKVYHDAYPPKEARANGREFTVWGYHGSFAPRPAKKFVATPDKIALMDWGVFPERDEQQDDWKVADWAIEQLKSPPKQPFFLAVGLRHPHVPCYATQKWFDLYPDDRLVMPPVKDDDRADTPRFSWYLHWRLPEPRLAWLKEANQWRPLVRAYLASISFVDSQVGRVLDALDASGLAGNTIVVLWSDHGWHLGEKGITGKNTLWERSTRVPLIFAGPGVARGARCERPAELLDIYPTLAELCGLPRKDGLDGHSLVPQLKDAKAPREWPAITTHGPSNHGIRSEQWRYIRYADGSEELYDLRSDPNEWTNLAADVRHTATKRELARWLPKVNAPPVAGSSTRLIELRNGVPYWEGKPIGADEKIP
jgi:arylsulfatase A-like enzyme